MVRLIRISLLWFNIRPPNSRTDAFPQACFFLVNGHSYLEEAKMVSRRCDCQWCLRPRERSELSDNTLVQGARIGLHYESFWCRQAAVPRQRRLFLWCSSDVWRSAQYWQGQHIHSVHTMSRKHTAHELSLLAVSLSTRKGLGIPICLLCIDLTRMIGRVDSVRSGFLKRGVLGMVGHYWQNCRLKFQLMFSITKGKSGLSVHAIMIDGVVEL